MYRPHTSIDLGGVFPEVEVGQQVPTKLQVLDNDWRHCHNRVSNAGEIHLSTACRDYARDLLKQVTYETLLLIAIPV